MAVIYLPQNTEMSPHRPCVCCAVIRIARLVFIRVVFVPRGTAEWPRELTAIAKRRRLAIGDFAHLLLELAWPRVNVATSDPYAPLRAQ